MLSACLDMFPGNYRLRATHQGRLLASSITGFDAVCDRSRHADRAMVARSVRHDGALFADGRYATRGAGVGLAACSCKQPGALRRRTLARAQHERSERVARLVVRHVPHGDPALSRRARALPRRASARREKCNATRTTRAAPMVASTMITTDITTARGMRVGRSTGSRR